MAPQDNDVRHVCDGCIGDQVLADEARTEGTLVICSYCGETRNATELEDLGDRINEVLQEHFCLTPNYPADFYDCFLASEGDWERRGDTADIVIANMAELDKQVAEDLRDLLSRLHRYQAVKDGEEDPYGREAQYEEREYDGGEFQADWDFALKKMRSQNRFFGTGVEDVLDRVFGDLSTHKSYEGRPVIREINPGDEGSSIWRARTAESDQELKDMLSSPARGLGPPSTQVARAGRMNSQGIPVFYGAMEKETCVSEVRPTVGSYVILGKFELLRSVRLLDMEVLKEVVVGGSYFEADYAEKRNCAAFLQALAAEMSRPVMPRDEGREYLSTQVVADYLAGNGSPPLDGIIFPSSQIGESGRNIVLFNHARMVQSYELPAGTDVDVSLPPSLGADDGARDIIIFETVSSDVLDDGPHTPDESEPFADPTLRLDIESIEVLEIERVTYGFSSRSVSRHRQTEEERDAFREHVSDAEFYSLLELDLREP